MQTRKIATFATSPELLEIVLQLPDGMKIIGAEWDFISKNIRLYVEGEMLPPVEIDERATTIFPQITRHEDGTMFWNF